MCQPKRVTSVIVAMEHQEMSVWQCIQEQRGNRSHWDQTSQQPKEIYADLITGSTDNLSEQQLRFLNRLILIKPVEDTGLRRRYRFVRKVAVASTFLYKLQANNVPAIVI